MKREKVISNYGNLSDDELSIFAGKVVQALTDNENFPTTTPPLEQLVALSEDYRLKQEAVSRGGSVLDKRLKGEARTQLLNMLSQLAHFVNVASNGHLAKLTSSGMILYKNRESVAVPSKIGRIKLKDGQLSGQLRVDCEAQKYIWEYEIQVGQQPSGESSIVWGGESYLSTSSRGNVIAGLPPGQLIYIRARACNGKGMSDWSDYVSMMVR